MPWMFGGGNGGRQGFFSLEVLFFPLPAEGCLRFSNGYHLEKERDMSQRPPKRPFHLELASALVDELRMCLDIAQAFTGPYDVIHHGGEFRRRAGNVVPVFLHLAQHVHQH